MPASPVLNCKHRTTPKVDVDATLCMGEVRIRTDSIADVLASSVQRDLAYLCKRAERDGSRIFVCGVVAGGLNDSGRRKVQALRKALDRCSDDGLALDKAPDIFCEIIASAEPIVQPRDGREVISMWFDLRQKRFGPS